MNARQRLSAEEGLTLIELAISISVLAVIIVPIMSSFLLGILENTSSRERIADSSSAQLISTFFIGDVQSAETITLGSAGCATGGIGKLSLTWTDSVGAKSYVVDYVTMDGTEGEHELHRMSCVDGGSPVDKLLALNVNPSSFLVTCSPTTDCSGAAPKSVSMRVVAESVHPNENSSYAPFDYTFTATRRVGA